jgi:hypothetical protein
LSPPASGQGNQSIIPEKKSLTFEQHPPNMSETITTVCAHAGMVLCASAEITVLDALENAPEEAVPSRCGRASI